MQTPLLRFLEMESMGTKISFATYTILGSIKPKIFVRKRLRMDRATQVSYIRTFMFFLFKHYKRLKRADRLPVLDI